MIRLNLSVAYALAALATGSALCQSPPLPPRVVLVELFTSEGCSSCPPADVLLRKLNTLKSTSGQTIVGIGEHVTYWNHGGWADPFSAETYTERQSDYARLFHLDSSYTPQMVVNGQQQAVGADTPEILRAINLDANQDQGNDPPRLNVEAALVQGKKIAVTFTINGTVPDHTELWAVIADDTATSSVLRGENSGKTLQHVSVARAITKLGRTVRGQTTTVQLDNPPPIKGQAPTGRHLILFMQATGLGRVFAVESRPLPADAEPSQTAALR